MVRIGAFALMLKGRKAAFTGARSCRSGRPGAERASRRAALTDADCADPPGATRIAPSRTSGVGPASPSPIRFASAGSPSTIAPGATTQDARRGL